MGKHPWLFAIIVLVLAGLIIGVSATDMWQYIIDFCKVGIDLFVHCVILLHPLQVRKRQHICRACFS